MKVLYLECNMGAAGDMLMASLSELLPEPEKFVEDLRALNLPQVEISRGYASSAGIRGARMHVFIRGEEEISEDVLQSGASFTGHDHDHNHDHKHGHHHTSITDIRRIIKGLSVSEKVKNDVLEVYKLIAEAESSGSFCSSATTGSSV
jgi:uncharacterized protein (DUF111 family)